MDDSREGGRGSAEEVAQLCRRVAELERVNERLRTHGPGQVPSWYADLLDNMSDIIYTTDRAGNLLSVNRAVKRTLGFDPQEVIGTHYSRWMSQEDFDRLEADRPATLQGRRVTNQVVLYDKQGNAHHVEINVGPLVVEGRIEGTQGIIRDVTKQRAAEQAVREDQEKLRSLFNATTESIILIDRQGTMLAMNETAARRLGRSVRELIGTNMADIGADVFPEPVVEHRRRQIRQVLDTKQPGRFEDVRAGQWFYTSMYPICDEQGEVRQIAIFGQDITERKRAEEDTRKFKAVFDHAGYGAAITDATGRLLYINRAFARMHGYEPAELSGRHLSIFHSPEQLPRVSQLNERLVAEGSFVGEEVWHVRKDGTEFPTLMNGTVVRDEQGRVLFWAGMAMDITERKQAEEEVAELQGRVEFILGATKTVLSIVDPDFNVRYVSPARQAIYGTYEGRKCHEYVRGLDQPCPECAVPKVLATKQTVVCDRVLTREGGRPIQVTTIPFQAENGAWLVAEVSVDITERKQLEQKLRESEERYRTVVETAGETIAIVAAQGTFLFMNTTAAQRLGGAPADFVGKTMGELFPQEVADAQMAHIRAVIASGQGQSLVSLTNVKGEPRWYGTTVEPLRDGTGKVIAGLVFARDIHDLTTARQEVQAYREKMIRAEHLASLGTLSAMLSHEMMQPLTVIRLSIQNALQMLDEGAPAPAALEDLNEGLAEVSHLTTILHRFRDFAGSAGPEAVHPVSLFEVAHKVARLLEDSARKARLTLDVEGLQALPSIRAQRKDVEQVFFILAQNAIEAAEGTRDHYFRVRGTVRDHVVHVQFEDDCGGIAPKVLEHLFEPFVTTKPAGEGMGLGLCVVERLVSRADGHLKVDSRWGAGTTFFVTWPIAPGTTGARL